MPPLVGNPCPSHEEDYMPKQRSLDIRLEEAKVKSDLLKIEKQIKTLRDKQRKLRGK